MYYEFTAPIFLNALTALKVILKKGEEFAKANGKSDADMLALRLASDMFPLSKQVQVASDNAKGAVARLTGKEAPKMEDTEKTFAELYARIDKTIAFIQSVKPEEFANAKDQTVRLAYFKDMHLTGDGYARFYAIPNFFFHVVTTYDILRANGVALGKTDYAGAIPFIKD